MAITRLTHTTDTHHGGTGLPQAAGNTEKYKRAFPYSACLFDQSLRSEWLHRCERLHRQQSLRDGDVERLVASINGVDQQKTHSYSSSFSLCPLCLCGGPFLNNRGHP